MIASALVLGLAGLAASFAPAELLTAWGAPATEQTILLVQLLGALYFAFAFLNWTAKGVMIGGIYARPVSLGNFLHFTMGALALAKQEFSHHLGVPVVVALMVYVVFAVLFGALAFGRSRPAPRGGRDALPPKAQRLRHSSLVPLHLLQTAKLLSQPPEPLSHGLKPM